MVPQLFLFQLTELMVPLQVEMVPSMSDRPTGLNASDFLPQKFGGLQIGVQPTDNGQVGLLIVLFAMDLDITGGNDITDLCRCPSDFRL